MTGNEVEARIWEWLQHTFPNDKGWQDPQFHCYRDVPLEIALVDAHAALEYNINNGGWSQVLWNCFGCWRQLLDLAGQGYTLIGASAQAEELKALYRLCERDEADCLRFMQRAAKKKDFSYFSKFTSRSYGGSEWDGEDLFFYGSGVGEMRRAWLAEHQEKILASLEAASQTVTPPLKAEQQAS